MSIAGVFFGADAVRNALTGQFRSLLGPTGSQVVEVMLKGAGSTSAGTLAGILGIALLLVEAVGVVVQLKDALNTIWETKEPEGAGMWWYLRTYLVSFAGILALGFLLAVSLVVSTGLAALSSWLGGGGSLWQVVNFLVSLAVLVFLFAMLFKWFPDAVVGWREALIGGLVTALLFNLGKLAHRLVHWHARAGVDLRCGRLTRGPPHLGLLFRPDRAVRGGNYSRAHDGSGSRVPLSACGQQGAASDCDKHAQWAAMPRR